MVCSFADANGFTHRRLPRTRRARLRATGANKRLPRTGDPRLETGDLRGATPHGVRVMWWRLATSRCPLPEKERSIGEIASATSAAPNKSGPSFLDGCACGHAAVRYGWTCDVREALSWIVAWTGSCKKPATVTSRARTAFMSEVNTLPFVDQRAGNA